MKPTLDIKRVEDCMEWLESTAELATSNQSIAWFIDHLGNLSKTLAFLNGQMAVAEEMLNKSKVNAYHTLIASSTANQKYFSPTLAKDYISAKVANEQYAYTICERASRTTLHQMDIFRSCLSSLKTELITSNYQ